jgi:hypothetical protein
MESLVGEIWDEDDIVEEPILNQGGGLFLVDAEESLGTLFDETGFEPQDSEEEEELRNMRVGDKRGSMYSWALVAKALGMRIDELIGGSDGR